MHFAICNEGCNLPPKLHAIAHIPVRDVQKCNGVQRACMQKKIGVKFRCRLGMQPKFVSSDERADSHNTGLRINDWGLIMKKARTRYGIIPNNLPLIKSDILIDGSIFDIYGKFNKHDDWLGLKIIARKRKGKANFYLAFNGERFADSHCYQAAQEIPDFLNNIEPVVLEVWNA